jgi:hypothetical protein
MLAKVSVKITLHYTIWLGVNAGNFSADAFSLTLCPLLSYTLSSDLGNEQDEIE